VEKNMKRYLWLKIVGVAVSLYALVGFFGVPYIVEKVAPQKVLEVTNGGKFSVQSASFNPFTFRLVVDKFSFKTPQNSDFIALRQLVVDVNPVEYLWKQAIVVDTVFLTKPLITIAKNSNGEMNFGWLLEGDDNASKEESQPLALIIRNFTLKNGGIVYRDQSEGKNYVQDVEDIGFHLENINLKDLSGSKGKMRLYASINDGGFVDVRSHIDSMAPFKLNGSVAFDSGKLYTPWKFFAHKLPIEVADGSLNVAFDYDLNSDDLNATKLLGLNVGVKKLRIIPKGGKETLFALDSLVLDNATVYPLKKHLESSGVRLSGIGLNAHRNPDGSIDWVNYLDKINRAFPEDENETKVPWSYAIDKVEISGADIGWRDNAPFSPYTADIKNITVATGAINSDEAHEISATISSDTITATRIRDNFSIMRLEKLDIVDIGILRAMKYAQVSKVSLVHPEVALKRLKNGTLDLEQYLYTSSRKKERKASAPWKYHVADIGIVQGNFNLSDEVPAKKVVVNLSGLDLEVKNFTSNPKDKNTISLSTNINETGKLTLKSGVVREPLRSQGNFTLTGMDVAPFDTYLEPSTYASLHRGVLSLGGDYSYDKNGANLKGKLGLSDWVVDDRRDDAVLIGWQNIGVTPFVYTYPQNRLKVKMVAVNGLYTNVIVDANKTVNFSTLSKPKPAGEVSKDQSNPFGVDIVKLVVNNGSANFSDLSLPLLFKTYIHDLNGEVLGISTTQDVVTYLKLGGGVDEYGMAKINGKLNTKAPKDFTDIHVNFDNLNLKQYTPYSLEFLGYKIAGGKLYLNLGYVIDHGKLVGKNQVVIKQIELGEEKAGGAKWPLRLVVALLEDSDGVIDIDLPIEGDINNPDFKYGKVVWQVIGNLLTKAITSPFRLLGSLMGLESEDDSLSSVGFEAGEAIILPPEREKLDKLTAMLIKRPKLTLSVHGGWEAQADDRALRLQKLIATIMGNGTKTSAHEAMSIEYLEATAKKSLDKSTVKELRTRMEEKYPNESDFVQHYSAALIERLIEKQLIAPPELGILAAQRAKVIVDYLHQNPALVSRVTVGENEKSKQDDKKHISSRMELSVK
jgi:hypothetical protein